MNAMGYATAIEEIATRVKTIADISTRIDRAISRRGARPIDPALRARAARVSAA